MGWGLAGQRLVAQELPREVNRWPLALLSEAEAASFGVALLFSSSPGQPTLIIEGASESPRREPP
jgi:hypothetical protein